MRKEDPRDPTKRESKDSTQKRIQGFHSAWVEIRTLAVQDVETVDVVVMAKEVVAEVPVHRKASEVGA